MEEKKATGSSNREVVKIKELPLSLKVNALEDLNDSVDVVPIHVKKRRIDKEKEEREATVKKAKKLPVNSKRRKETQNAKCRVLPEDSEFLQKYFSTSQELDPSKVFPGEGSLVFSPC